MPLRLSTVLSYICSLAWLLGGLVSISTSRALKMKTIPLRSTSTMSLRSTSMSTTPLRSTSTKHEAAAMASARRNRTATTASVGLEASGGRRASGQRAASILQRASMRREALRAEQRWRLGNLQSRCGRLMHGNANGWLRMRTSSVNPGRGVLGSKTTLENQDVEYSRNAPV